MKHIYTIFSQQFDTDHQADLYENAYTDRKTAWKALKKFAQTEIDEVWEADCHLDFYPEYYMAEIIDNESNDRLETITIEKLNLLARD